MTLKLISKEGTSTTLIHNHLQSPDGVLVMDKLNPDPENFVSTRIEPEQYTVIRGMMVLRGWWQPKPKTRKELMMEGVEFEGVMCSLMAEDMWGLAAAKPYVLLGMDFNFKFENGTVLNLNPSNWEAFEQVWFPARVAFFPPA